ncbi:MAG: SIS domain-containing protein [Clostridia bacterium]|nr:SIS domain-containing protein [Clostridia bacterium]
MRSVTERYISTVTGLLGKILDTQSDAIDAAASAVADALAGGGTLFAVGPGHSHMLAEELFYRAGGLVKVYPILDSPLMLHAGASRSSDVERIPGYAATLVGYGADPREGDVMIIFSNSGRNSVPVDMALMMKERGVKTIAVTNLSHSRASSSRHPSGKRLFEICDIVIDNGGCVGDAALNMNGYICGPTSTVIGAAVVQCISCGAVGELCARGLKPEVFSSSNVDGGDVINHEYIKKYNRDIPIL